MTCKYVNQNGTAAMLTSTELADVIPEVNHTGEKACKGSTPALKPRANVTPKIKRKCSQFSFQVIFL